MASVMRNPSRSFLTSCLVLISVLVPPLYCDTPTLSDIFKLTTPDANINNQQTRTARDNNSKYFLGRYAAADRASDERSRSLKPEENTGATGGAEGASSLEKRCTRCDEDRNRQYYDRYDPYRGSNQYYDRSNDQRRYREDPYERYDRYERDRYDPYEYESRYYDQRRDRDRDNTYDRYYSMRDMYDRYDRNRGSEPRGDRYYDRYNDRGVGYDNRGYDNRGYAADSRGGTGYGGYRPSGYEDQYSRDRVQDRNYYYRPQEGGSYGGNYASSWNYGGANRNDDYYGRDKYDRNNPNIPKPTDPATESRYYGSGGSQYRPRDPYDQYAYRGTSYLYGRPSSTTTLRPPGGGDEANSVTDNSKPNSQG